MQAHADDFGHREGISPAQQRRFGVYAPDPPAEHAERIDHRRVRISADDEVRKSPVDTGLLGLHHDLGDLLQVDLMDDAGPRGRDAQAGEGLCGPFDEGIALFVAGKFMLQIALHRSG